MSVQENVLLAPLTTLGVGGAARFFSEAKSVDEVIAALGEAKRRGLGVAVLGGGSNTLVPDAGVDGFVLRIAIPGIEHVEERDDALLVVGAGVAWDAVVLEASARQLWGIENLASIPGTAGAAPVQNIGAYGVEFASVFAWAEAVERASGEVVRISARDAAFGYRESVFKREDAWVVTRVALKLSHTGTPNIAYKDLALARERGVSLTTPREIAEAVRTIRAEKMPAKGIGSAGSFFKNPVITSEAYAALRVRFPGLVGFESSEGVKVPLAWILDHALGMRGFTCGPVRLHEKQPLILTTLPGATEADIEACVHEVRARVYEATNIEIEREVETLIAR